MFLFILYNPVSAEEKVKKLTIYTWHEYLETEVIQAFENKYNVQINEIYFDSDDERTATLLQTEGEGFDVISINGSAIESYLDAGWLRKLPINKIPNIQYIDKHWINSFKSSDGYAIPYFWGLLGIAYRKDLISQPINSWMQLFTPSDELKGKVLMVNSSRDIIGAALMALGYSANSGDINELKQAEALLIKQKPNLARLGYLKMNEESDLVKGTIVAASIYGGDALNLAQYNKEITYIYPKEGSTYWVDFFAIAEKSKKTELAALFINFINDPKWAASNAISLHLPTPNNAAKKYVPKEMLNNPLIYPEKELLEKSEFHIKLDPQNERIRAGIFTRVTR